jgi:hypothetical protein
MTTHEMRPEMETATGRGERPEATGSMPAQPHDAAFEPEPPQDVVQEDVQEDKDSVASTPAPESTEQALFADDELSDFHSRWTDVQSAFVDDPRDCVQKADGLVADVVDKLTAQFAQARSRLEEQWSRGEEVSTEDLRIALQRYREFFERLLAV